MQKVLNKKCQWEWRVRVRSRKNFNEESEVGVEMFLIKESGVGGRKILGSRSRESEVEKF